MTSVTSLCVLLIASGRPYTGTQNLMAQEFVYPHVASTTDDELGPLSIFWALNPNVMKKDGAASASPSTKNRGKAKAKPHRCIPALTYSGTIGEF